MSKFLGRCKRCGKYEYESEPCHCDPYLVYFPDYFGEEKETIWGNSFEEIVEEVAKRVNEDDPQFDEALFDEPIEVTDKNGVTKKFNCIASISIDYYPEEIMEE